MMISKYSIANSVLVAILLHISNASAFLQLGSPKIVRPPTSPTTLFYRDDVPPIGSSPTWEIPNDFQQFLTQCSMQSFMFLCHSLRDDLSVRWLHEFTEPVLQNTLNGTEAGLKPMKEAKKKVSLAEAADSALADMETELMAGLELAEVGARTSSKPVEKAESQDIPKPNKSIQPAASAIKEFRVRASPQVSPYSDKKEFVASTSSKKDLKTQTKPIESGFTAFSRQATTLSDSLNVPATEAQDTVSIASGPKTSWAPTKSDKKGVPANTDVSSLYGTGSIPMKKNTETSAPEPSKNEESSSDDVTSLYGTGSIPKKKKSGSSEAPKQSFSPFGQKAKVSSKPEDKFATTSSTSSLYPAPEKKSTVENDKGDETKRYKTLPGLKYHGLAMFNRTKFPTWDSYFEQLVKQPKRSFIVESTHKHVPSYEFDIDPSSLCNRMLSVRSQIAQEFEHDLTVIAQMGGHTLKSYWKVLKDQRSERQEKKRQQQELEDQKDQSLEQSISKNGGARSTEDDKMKDTPYVHRANLLFLDSSVSEDDDYAPSPLRKGNFDLLTLLTTQEAIHRVLNDPKRQARKSAEHGSNQFLQDFYVTRLLSHFSGDQPYGRADDFLEELLESAPRMVTVGNDEEKDHDGIGGSASDEEDELTKDLTYLIDPVGIAETILNERENVALEWKEQLGEQTKEAHMNIRKMVLSKQLMGEDVKECRVVESDGTLEDFDDSCFE